MTSFWFSLEPASFGGISVVWSRASTKLALRAGARFAAGTSRPQRAWLLPFLCVRALAGATSDTNSFAGDPRGRVGREKDGHGGNIPRFAQSAERSNRDIALDAFLAKKPLRRCAFASV